MIQELQGSHLKLVKKYSFANQIAKWLPNVQDAIRQAVLRDLKEWFRVIKEGAFNIGKLAFHLSTNPPAPGEVEEIQSAMRVAPKMDEIMDQKEREMDSAQIDFTPLFQCIHIHDVLNKRVQLKLEFDESRRLQADVILTQTIPSLKSGNIIGLERYIHEVTGFFVIEATVIVTTQDFRSRSSVETLWQTATNKMNAHLYEALSECKDPKLFLDIKLLVESFIGTMEVYGFAVNSLSDLMVSLMDRYAELLKNKYFSIAEKLIKDNDYKPMEISNTDELEEILDRMNISKEMIPTFPRGETSNSKILPFSNEIAPQVQGLISMINDFYKFSDGFAQQSYEIDDLVKKTVESMLASIVEAITAKINISGISMVFQILRNAEYYANACHRVEQVLMEKRYAHRTMRVTLQGVTLLKDLKKTAEVRIYAIINENCNSFLDLLSYDWASETPRREAATCLSGHHFN